MFFATSRKLKKIIGDAPKQNLEYFYLYNLKLNDISVNLYVSKKRATKATHIHCTESGDIMWEQFYPFGGMSRPSREKKYVLKPTCEQNAITVVAFRGRLCYISGLDDNIFTPYPNSPSFHKIFIMEEASITLFLSQL